MQVEEEPSTLEVALTWLEEEVSLRNQITYEL